MKIIKSKSKKWVEKQGYSKKILLGKSNLREFSHVQEVKIKPGEIAIEHYHKKQTEVFYFFNKNGYWIINNKKIIPDIGDILIIEPFDKHTVINDSLEDYVYLAIKFSYVHDDFY